MCDVNSVSIRFPCLVLQMGSLRPFSFSPKHPSNVLSSMHFATIEYHACCNSRSQQCFRGGDIFAFGAKTSTFIRLEFTATSMIFATLQLNSSQDLLSAPNHRSLSRHAHLYLEAIQECRTFFSSFSLHDASTRHGPSWTTRQGHRTTKEENGQWEKFGKRRTEWRL